MTTKQLFKLSYTVSDEISISYGEETIEEGTSQMLKLKESVHLILQVV